MASHFLPFMTSHNISVSWKCHEFIQILIKFWRKWCKSTNIFQLTYYSGHPSFKYFESRNSHNYYITKHFPFRISQLLHRPNTKQSKMLHHSNSLPGQVLFLGQFNGHVSELCQINARVSEKCSTAAQWTYSLHRRIDGLWKWRRKCLCLENL